MIYKLASRDNIDSERFQSWPAVLNNSFTRFNNLVEEYTFGSEEDVLNWLESKCRTKSNNRSTNSQEFKNGDPNKIYSIYQCDHANSHHGCEVQDKFVYSLRFKKPTEAYTTFNSEKGVKTNSSFKKICVQQLTPEMGTGITIDYSSDVREIKKEHFEGVYPLDTDPKDPADVRYMDFVKTVHDMDTEENKKKDYSIVVADSIHGSKWLEYFISRLKHVERYLEFFAKGGNIYFNISPTENHAMLMSHITNLLDANKHNTPEDNDLQYQIRALVADPILYNQEIYQVRYNKSLLSWHSNYAHILSKYNLIPSKQFAEMILNFNLADFFKQTQSDENLFAMIKNIREIYKINDVYQNGGDIRLIGNGLGGYGGYGGYGTYGANGYSARNAQKPKFLKVTKSFNSSNAPFNPPAETK